MADYNNSTNDTIISGKYRDSNNIYNTGNNVTINGGGYWSSDFDYIDNSGSYAVIYANSCYDEIMNRAGGSNSFTTRLLTMVETQLFLAILVMIQSRLMVTIHK